MGAKAENGEAAVYQRRRVGIDPRQRILTRGQRHTRRGIPSLKAKKGGLAMAASNRVSHSLLDPWLTGPLKRLYPRLSLPRSLPPEAIIGCGHAAAAAGALGFALACQHPWAGLAGAAGVVLNHTCDVLDGTHARSTGQCRNGGELLDHFVDPLSFSYWAAGLAYAAQGYSSWAPWLGVVGVIAIYAMALLTSIRAKMIGEFTLNRFGPTEFKTLLVLFGVAQAFVGAWGAATPAAASLLAAQCAWWFVTSLVIAGLVQLVVSLVKSVRDVNAAGAAPPDTTEWKLTC
jgi:archaetidylinositol phosphate synthase